MGIRSFMARQKELRSEVKFHHERARLSGARMKLDALQDKKKIVMAEEAVRHEKKLIRELKTQKYREAATSLQKGFQRLAPSPPVLGKRTSAAGRRIVVSAGKPKSMKKKIVKHGHFAVRKVV